MLHISLHRHIHCDDRHHCGERVEPHLHRHIVAGLEGLKLDVGEDALERVDKPWAEVGEEFAQCEGADSHRGHGEDALVPGHVAGVYGGRAVVAHALAPLFPADELHRQVIHKSLQHVAVDVCAEADVDVQKRLHGAEYPVGHGAFSAEHHAEHAQNGGNRRYGNVERDRTCGGYFHGKTHNGECEDCAE